MAIFKKEKKKDESFMASAPEEDETAGEIKHIWRIIWRRYRDRHKD